MNLNPYESKPSIEPLNRSSIQGLSWLNIGLSFLLYLGSQFAISFVLLLIALIVSFFVIFGSSSSSTVWDSHLFVYLIHYATMLAPAIVGAMFLGATLRSRPMDHALVYSLIILLYTAGPLYLNFGDQEFWREAATRIIQFSLTMLTTLWVAKRHRFPKPQSHTPRNTT